MNRRRATLALIVLAAGSLPAACVDTQPHRVPTPPPAHAARDRLPATVDVQLAAGVGALVGADGAVVVRDAGGATSWSGTLGRAGTRIEFAAGRVRLAGHDLGPPPVQIVPQGTATVTVDGRPYRGDLVLEPDPASGGARVLNRLRIEDYLYGVVPSEMPASFGLEALKAQAVAARTYALAETLERGWLYGDTRSQAYRGLAGESPLSQRAVRETRGQVLAVQGRVFSAFYHSTCGGRTLPAAQMFPGAAPGVMDREVDCPDCGHSPHFAWSRRFAVARVASATGLPGAELTSASATPAVWPGRPRTVHLDFGARRVELTPAKLREQLAQGVPIAQSLPSTRFASAPRVEGGELVIEGRGWGHGVGLCQYGAAGFAARGADYRAILARYYPGAELLAGP